LKILLIDIETSPCIAYAWTLRDKFIPVDRLIESGHTLCYTAKWLGSKELIFDSVHASSPRKMISGVHKLLDEADVLVHYNGATFDVPVLEAEFLLHGMPPPSPFHQVDLYKTVQRFRLPSRKLDFVAQALGLGAKVRHKGMDLWKECMAGDDAAWRTMERYNRQDVKLLEKLYYELRPWILNHPNMAIADGDTRCPHCGSLNLKWKGYRESITRRYRRFVCKDCGAWGWSVKCERDTAKVRGF